MSSLPSIQNMKSLGSARALAILQASKEQKEQCLPAQPRRNFSSLFGEESRSSVASLNDDDENVNENSNMSETAVEAPSSGTTAAPKTWGLWDQVSMKSAKLSARLSSQPTHDNAGGQINLKRTHSDRSCRESSSRVTEIPSNNVTSICQVLVPALASNSSDDACFAVAGGRVMSVAMTKDGEFCIVGLSSGCVQLFDLCPAGVLDPEDRFGHLIGRLESSSMRSNLMIHLALGEPLVTTGDSLSKKSCSHLFVGARQGCTTMLAIDLNSLRAIKRNRGFIGTARFGLQEYQYTDARLRGLTSVISIDCSGEEIAADEEGMEDMQSVAFTHRVKYRMICGRAFGTYCIWDVELVGRTKASPATICLDCNGNPMEAAGEGDELEYFHRWTPIFSGSVSAPNMSFGAFITPRNIDSSSQVRLWNSTSVNSGGAYFDASQCLDFNDEHSKMSKLSEGLSNHRMSLLVGPFDKDLKRVIIDGLEEGASNSNWIPGTKDVLASSADGSVLFGGKYELVVQWFSVESEAVVGKLVFKISELPSELDQSNLEKKRSRHLRMIERVVCTSDGSFAVMQCSDNAVLLYSVCNLFGRGQPAATREGCCGRTLGGYLTLLFQAKEGLKMEMSIAKMVSDESSSDCSECAGKLNQLSHINSGLVSLAVAWWTINESGGVKDLPTIRVFRLSDRKGRREKFFTVFPNTVVVGGLGVLAHVSDSQPSIAGRAAPRQCSVCGDRFSIHWSIEALADSSTRLPETGARHSQRSKFPKKKAAEGIERKRELVQQPALNDNTLNTGTCVEGLADDRLDSDGMDLESRNAELERELQAARQETELVLRKADRRFQQEKELRRCINNERRDWEAERRSLLLQLVEARSAADESKCSVRTFMKQVLTSSVPLLQTLRQMEDVVVGESSVSSSSSSSPWTRVLQLQGHSSASKQDTVKAPFCIVCQAHTADVVLSCGHICLCFSHACHMDSIGKLSKCPVCNCECTSKFVRVAAFERM